jgi:hypothetical protein
MVLTTMFVDLSSFTTLTSTRVDEADAQMLDRYSELVRHAAMRRDGKVVKQIGDAFMLVFDHAGDAIACGLELRYAAAGEPDLPAVRISAHAGDVLYYEGDYVGTKVNLIPPAVTEIRVVDIVGLDKQADGGTHVRSTGEIGRFEVVKTESKGKGNKRIRIRVHDA